MVLSVIERNKRIRYSIRYDGNRSVSQLKISIGRNAVFPCSSAFRYPLSERN
jgi:hypothetical protein